MIIVDGKNILGKRIRFIRTRKRITQEQLAARLHVQGINMDRSNISRIEHQTRIITDYEVFGIANALGVSILDLYK
jgi:transcriptional regulator with XRE-family HTH domain